MNNDCYDRINGNQKVKIYTDNEGGNVRIYSPNSKYYAETDMYNETNLRIYFWNQESNVYSGGIVKKLTGEVNLDHMNQVVERYNFGGPIGSSGQYRIFGMPIKDGWGQNKVYFPIPFNGPSYNISIINNSVDFLYFRACTVTGMEVVTNAIIVSVDIDVAPYVSHQATAFILVSKK